MRVSTPASSSTSTDRVLRFMIVRLTFSFSSSF
jgi:hypothetical protein